MYRKQAVLCLVGLLVVTAGCVGGVDLPGAGGADGADGSDGTDGSDGAAGSDGSSSSDGAGDGSAGDGNADGGAGEGTGSGDVTLVENRTAALLEAGSYTTVWRMQYTEDGGVTSETRYTTAVDAVAERSLFSMLVTDGDVASSDYQTYHADGRSYQRYGAGEDATYGASAGEFTTQPSLFDAGSYVTSETYLDDFDAVGSETFDGVTVTRYERTDRPGYLAGQAQADSEVRWTGFTYVVLVDEDGLVRSESWTSEGVTADDVPVSVGFSFSLTDLGSTTVEEPAWVATARADGAA